MAGRKTILTPEILSCILQYIKAGSYDWVACEAVGIGVRTFYRWMESGERYPDSIYRQFWQEVCRAKAEARVVAEVKVREANPLAWLRFGPGREKPGRPGWTESQEITGTHEITGRDGGPIVISDAREELTRRIASLAARIGVDKDTGESEPD